MNPKRLLVAAALVVALLGCVSDAASIPGSSSPLNIVVILSDDEPALDGRLTDLMPNLRALRDEAVSFEEFNSSTPLCCPARATLLTGLYAHNHGVGENDYRPFDPSRTLATELDALDYRTFLVGKYMNMWGKCGEAPCPPPVPPGWDEFYGLGLPYAYFDYNLWHDGRKTRYGSAPADYLTDVIAGLATKLIRDTPSEQPLFAWIAPIAPHEPTVPAPRHAQASCRPGAWTPSSWNEADVSDKPAYVQAAPPLRKADDLRATCRTLLAVDDLVRDVRQALIQTGRWDRTIFVYVGDNGMNMGEHRLLDKSAPYATRVPAFFHGPWQPRVIEDRVSNIDLAATICELAGCTLTGDGTSLVPLLSGRPLQRRSWLEELPVAHKGVPAWASVITDDLPGVSGQWHYVEYETREHELYATHGGPCWQWKERQQGDPCELTNLAGLPQYAEIEQALRAELSRLQSTAPER